MDALVSAFTRNTNVIMVWAWMLWLAHLLGMQTLIWVGHDALVSAFTQNTNIIMVWAWMLWLSFTWNTNVVIGCAGYCVWCNLENRDAWYFEPSKHFECVLRLSRRPHPERLAKYALVARLRSQEQQQSKEATIQMFVPVRKAKDQIISHVQVY